MTIEIDIKDNKRFLDVAIVVDRQDFRVEVERIRQEFNIPFPLNAVQLRQFIMDLYKQKKETTFRDRIEKARKTLRLPITFLNVIEAVALTNRVDDSNYKPAFLTHKLDVYNEEAGEVSEIYSIVLSPNARDSDVLKALQEYRDQLDNEKGVGDYKYIGTVWGKEKDKPSIKSYRRWYWENQSGRTYQQICEDETDKCQLKDNPEHDSKKLKGCTCFDEGMIRKSVATYEKLIWKTPTF